ncbi:hypothetical protein RHSIM_Rhsim11G0009000 [Rhododendron simsii]|uniref:Uncharacterized protein n=1 Tax=Rhododendron simsii TaxID=118357 RepID=A0A834LAJ1_RHOSS|nr:hypothetical protein RHSIM_RhsimUnG0046500 [Rhododendron simsii]KAF7126340.1 hypothetical protein RHSIM_Rhsim11G0009000 [Rhododendron simsii]
MIMEEISAGKLAAELKECQKIKSILDIYGRASGQLINRHSLGGVVGALRNVILIEGLFTLYKGLLPTIMSVTPLGVVFYRVYDILKLAYHHSPKGRKWIQYMKEQGQELSALDQLELGPVRSLLHGGISGACAEASTYPFEVLLRQLQLPSKANKLSALATFVKIVERGGILALYAGLCPS